MPKDQRVELCDKRARRTQRLGSRACKPIAWDRALGPFGGKLPMNDGPASRKLHRKPGIVLIVNDRARIVAQLRLAGDEITERMNVLASDQALLDRLQ